MYSSAYVWAKIIAYLEEKLTSPVVLHFFDAVEVLECTDEKLVLYTPTSFLQETIMKNTASYIKEAMKALFDADITLSVLSAEDMKSYDHYPRALDFLEFNPQFTFEKFVVGSSNAFAHAAALAVADNPGKNRNYNPLFIYAPPGLGKTHLLYAIASKVHKNDPDANIIYVSAEQFTNELINAIQLGDNVRFRDKYRNADLLLIDDIQFIAGRNSTQEEYFHTFNVLYESGKQIVMTSDRPPEEMAHLEERLRTRFQWGMTTEICPPDYENRMAILNNKAQESGVTLPQDVASFIAENVTTDVRKLEGSLKILLAAAKLNNLPITVEMAERVLKNLRQNPIKAKPSPALILQEVCKFYSLDIATLRSQQRTKAVSEARQVAMYLLQKLAGLSTTDIGKELDKDHSTVVFGCRKIRAQLMDLNSGIKDNIRDINTSIENQL